MPKLMFKVTGLVKDEHRILELIRQYDGLICDREERGDILVLRVHMDKSVLSYPTPTQFCEIQALL